MEKYKIDDVLTTLFTKEDCYEISIDAMRKCGSDAAFVLAAIKKIYETKKVILPIDIYKEIHQWNIEIIRRRVKQLSKKGFVKIGIPDNEKAVLLMQKKLSGIGIGNCICSWCGCKTLITHKHHFPIRKSKGGNKTIGICPNCHAEFHIMDTAIIPLI